MRTQAHMVSHTAHRMTVENAKLGQCWSVGLGMSLSPVLCSCEGNAACIYTSVGAHAEWFISRFSVGMVKPHTDSITSITPVHTHGWWQVGVNIGVPVPREPFSFGGSNRSKFGGFPSLFISTTRFTGTGKLTMTVNLLLQHNID